VGRILHGTSSWSTPGWVGPFYPAGTAPADFLEHYAKQFPTVEADVTYYRIPDARMVEGWKRRTPDGFVLAAKFPRSIVHAGSGKQPDASRLLVPEAVQPDVDRFLAAMALLEERCGPLVLQFPYFNRSAFTERAPFLERLDAFLARLPMGFRYAVELRNKGWVDATLLALLARHRTAFVLVEMSYMPHPADLAQRFDLLTTDFLYARLIGDREAVEAKTEAFDQVVVDRSAALERWAGLLASLAPRVETAYLYANNHYAGHGPATIRQLKALLDAQG
jgi:uncharacterized protein YecE (DUF72 family)